tara:strand:- start:451 stop:558 length:108 start_codon:yes stop_codon:yes gene_type:complete
MGYGTGSYPKKGKKKKRKGITKKPKTMRMKKRRGY